MDQTRLSLLDRLRDEPAPQDWERLVQVYSPLLRRWLGPHTLQGADTDDLVQEVLTVVVRRLGEFRHSGQRGAFRNWLRTILTHRLRDFWRRQLSRPLLVGGTAADEWLAQLEQPDSDLARRWDAEHDQHVMARLLELIRPEFRVSTWEAFQRYALQGLDAAQVAAELGLSVNAVCIARSRVMRRLRQEASGLLDGDERAQFP